MDNDWLTPALGGLYSSARLPAPWVVHLGTSGCAADKWHRELFFDEGLSNINAICSERTAKASEVVFVRALSSRLTSAWHFVVVVTARW
jgi:hypothetical protein